MNKEYRTNLHFIFYAVAIAVGVWIGVFINGNTKLKNHNIQNKYWKLNDVLDYVNENYVDSIDANVVIEETLSSILLYLDPHSSYISLEEFQLINEQMSGNFEGIGIQFRIEKDTVLVVHTIPNGPSEKTGILAGDRIVEVDGEGIAGIGISNTEVMKKLKGKKGSKVQIKIQRRNVVDVLDFTIARDVIPTYSIDYSDMLSQNIGYIKLSAFNLHSDIEFKDALNGLMKKGMKSLIFDLRGNGGGSLEVCIRILDNFFDSNELLVYTQGLNRNRRDYLSSKKGSFKDGKIVVLVDEFSASASEIVAGAIQDHDRGVIIGRRTFGKGLVQEQIALKDGSAIRLTVARYYTPLGRSIQRNYERGFKQYYEDLLFRMENEDLISEENKDTVKYVTKSGKTLYGGGGITPDIIVKQPDLYNDKHAKIFLAHLHSFTFEYTDVNRYNLQNKYKNSQDFISNFEITPQFWQEYMSFIKNAIDKDVQTSSANLSLSNRTYINTLLKAGIGRNLYDYDCYYSIIREADEMLIEAIKYLKTAK